jgi:hypothetical protein
VWYENAGTRKEAKLQAAKAIEVEWPGKTPKPEWNWWNPAGKELVTQWRTTPAAVDFNGDKLPDLVMLDHEGYLALFPRRRDDDGKLLLMPGERLFVDEAGKPLQMNAGRAGKSGRRKLCVVDWDGDGRLDVLANGTNAEWLRNVRDVEGRVVLKNMGPLGKRNLAAHDTSPSTVDWNRDGRRDLILGAEDGVIYYLPHSAAGSE